MPPTKLHVAKSLNNLKDFVTKGGLIKKLQSLSDEKAVEKLKSVFKEATFQHDNGDEEMAFVLFMRFAEILNSFKSRKYVMDKLKDQFKLAYTYAVQLENSLGQRYDLQLKLDNKMEPGLKETVIVNNEKNIFLPEIINHKKPEKIEITSQSITCSQLFELFKDTSIIIIDIRTHEDYNLSHISRDFVINIPEDYLKEGMTGVAIERLLMEPSLQIFKNRSKVDYVILLDWNSSENQKSQKIEVLNTALTKWDTNNLLKSDPFILENGYEHWLRSYPMLTTNPHVSRPQKKEPAATLLSMEYDFSQLEEQNFTDSSFGKDEVFEESESVPVSNGTPVRPTINRSVKPARLLPSTPKEAWKEPMVQDNLDEQEKMADKTLDLTKQQLNIEKLHQELVKETGEAEINQDNGALMELTTRYKEYEVINQELQELLKQQINETNKLRKDYDDLQQKNITTEEINRKKNLENKKAEQDRLNAEVERLRQARKMKEAEKKREALNIIPKLQISPENIPKPKEIVFKSFYSEEKPDLNENENQDVKRDNSKPVIFELLKPEPETTRKGLSRSHSSPNITQLLSAEKKISFQNRGNKPERPDINRELKPNDLSAARLRNFNPLYSSHGKVQTGLKNLGNTCFMNSVIQCLYNTVPLAEYLNNQYREDINRYQGTRGAIVEELSVVFKQLSNENSRWITPIDFKNTVSKFLPVCVGYEQQDAHEFLTMLLEKLHDDVNLARNENKQKPPELEKLDVMQAVHKFCQWNLTRNDSKIVDTFEGILQSKLRCSYCHTESNSYEMFSCLSVPIPSQSRCSLNACVQSLFKGERISGEAAWDCPSCKCKREAEKKMAICKLPNILVIHLKRFSFNGRWRQKLQTNVDFDPQEDLDMDNFLETTFKFGRAGQTRYELYAVVNHYGTLEGGHYISSCAKLKGNGKWFKYDDHEVSDISSNSVQSKAAYILFYSRI